MSLAFRVAYGKYVELATPIVAYWATSLYYELWHALDTPYVRSKRLNRDNE